MKKCLQSGWIRMGSCIVCAISIVSLLIGVFGFIFITEFRDTEGIYETGYKEVAENYVLYAASMVEQGKIEQLQKVFEEKKINCNIDLVYRDFDENGIVVSTLENKVSIGEINSAEMLEMEVAQGAHYRYRENSLLGVLLGYSSYFENSAWVEYPIQKVVFDPADGIFYYQTDLGLYRVEDITVNAENEKGYYDYKLRVEDGKVYYYNGYYKKTLDPSMYQEWEWVNIQGYGMELSSQGVWKEKIEVLPEGSILAEDIILDKYKIYWDIISVPNSDVLDMYQVQLSWSYGEGANSLFTEWANLSNMLIAFDVYAVPMIILSLLLVLVSFGLMIYSANSDKEKIGFLYNIPVICYSLVIGVVVFGIAVGTLAFGNWLMSQDIGRLLDMMKLALCVALILVWLVLGWFQNVVTRIKCKTLWKTSEVYYVIVVLKKSWKYISRLMKWLWEFVTTPLRALKKVCQEVIHSVLANISVFLSGIFLFSAVSFVELFLYMWARWDVIVFFSIKVVEAVVLFIVLFHMERLHEGSKRIAAGDLLTPVDTTKMYWKFKEHGENINKAGDGIALAVKERMKSEHFKTELITNVSHDIKTPLTSIINYVDLIKKEDISDEKIQGYVEVLDRQSARLKKLIEDLMEASKASTGNLIVSLEECDVEVLLTQIIGEFEERLQKNQLEVVVNKPDYPVKMMADGRHMWRIVDNLLNNACKYSLPNSRVYVSLEQEQNEVIMIFKNISKTALNIPSEELLERFVRGDSSRNTEGSGLGLSIAQSLTELMQGCMKLEIDGDLFKVILRFPAITIR